jgi:tubulin monoglycylase TTLL3/8
MDRFIHLTNNSVAKYADTAIITHEIEGNMWNLEEMQNYL